MSTRGAASWTCPWCQRLVPGRETRCHCGCDRAVAEAQDKADGGDDQTGGRAVLVVVLLALGGLVLFAAARQRNKSIQAAQAVSSAAPEGRPSGPPATYPDVRGGAPGYTPPSPWLSPPPRVEAFPVPVAPAAKATDAASPKSTVEEDWEKAVELLEPRLQKIAMDTGSLESSYHPFASLCLAPDASGGSRAAGSWLSSLKNAPLLSGFLITETGRVDCPTARASLLARANQVKSELSTAEDLARTSRVLPGNWRKLVATHQLEIWDGF